MEAKTDNAAGQPAGTITTIPPPAPRRRLHPAAIRLAAVAILFAAWLGYLVYLVVTLPHTSRGEPLILSRSQLLVSELDVIARVDSIDPGSEVIIEEVLYPKENPPLQVGDKVRVSNLGQCKPLPIQGDSVQTDWTSAGSYLLPLLQEGDHYRVAPTPPSPGYPPTGSHAGPPRIYPASAAAKAQYRTLQKP